MTTMTTTRQAGLPACADLYVDPAWFDAEGDPQQRRQAEAKAKAVCAGCPVRDACLAAALNGDEYGIWGGLTREERDTITSRPQPRRQAATRKPPLAGVCGCGGPKDPTARMCRPCRTQARQTDRRVCTDCGTPITKDRWRCTSCVTAGRREQALPLIRDYLDLNIDPARIATDIGVHQRTIWTWLHQAGDPRYARFDDRADRLGVAS